MISPIFSIMTTLLIIITHHPLLIYGDTKLKVDGPPPIQTTPNPTEPTATEINPMEPEPVDYNPCTPSPCGSQGQCTVILGMATCTCKEDLTANPPLRCRPECVANHDCPSNKTCIDYTCINYCEESDSNCGKCFANSDCPSNMACIANKCRDPPCSDVCGTNAICRVLSHLVHCFCVEGFEGDPFVSCKPVNLENKLIIIASPV